MLLLQNKPVAATNDDISVITYYSPSQEQYIKVHLKDMPRTPYVVDVVPHPTVKNHNTYKIRWDIQSFDINYLDFGECSPGEWIYPFIAAEINALLQQHMTNDQERQLIEEELQCL